MAWALAAGVAMRRLACSAGGGGGGSGGGARRRLTATAAPTPAPAPAPTLASEPAPARKVAVLRSTTTDGFVNLAAEELLFRTAALDTHTLFLWRNRPTVVIGRNQNPWKETHVAQLAAHSVDLIRRHSGGGAVYQDLGNSIFTFVCPREHHSKQRNTGIVLAALARFGIAAEASGRNDILLGGGDGRKVSGSAYKISGPRVCHHGTLLVDVDLDMLQRVLNPGRDKLLSKGVASVRARVANLAALCPLLTHDSLCDALAEEFCAAYGHSPAAVPVQPLDADAVLAAPLARAYHDQIRDWQWRFGETPDFSHVLEHRFDWGSLELHLDSAAGRITKAVLFSDSLFPHFVDAVRDALIGVPYDRTGIRAALAVARHRLAGEECAAHVDSLEAWLVDAI